MNLTTYQTHMDAGSDHLLNLNIKQSILSFDAAIESDPSSFPKQWMRGLALFFDKRYQEGTTQFVTNLNDNPHDVEEVVWACMCDMKRLGLHPAQKAILPCPKDLRVPMQEIYNLFSGQGNIADVLHRRDDFTSTAYGHFYVALYLDCLILQNQNDDKGDADRMNMIGLSAASRHHYNAAAQTPSKDFMGKLSVALNTYIATTEEASTKESTTTSSTTTSSPNRQTFPSSSFSSSLVGCWQLSSGHHADDVPSTTELHQRLTTNIQHGFTSLDMGDIYTGVEESVGIYLSTHPNMIPLIEIHTKLVPDLNLLNEWTIEKTKGIVRRSINRLQKINQLHLMQFHWWDWTVGNHVEAYRGLCSLVPEFIKHVGVTNYDEIHLKELLEAGLPVESNQIQYSLIDRRCEAQVDLCTQHNVRLLCYGSLAGGFLSDRWLRVPDPVPFDVPLNAEALSEHLTNRSLIKYYLVIREFGGWQLFQWLLTVLRGIADRHHEISLATVAQAWVLSRRRVAGVIIGLTGKEAHLTCAGRAQNLSNQLDAADEAAITAVLDRSKGPNGPFYDLERVRDGVHNSIMRFNCGELYTMKHAVEYERRIGKMLVAEFVDDDVKVSCNVNVSDFLKQSMVIEGNGFGSEFEKKLRSSMEALKE